jgi:hypothetical protein
MSETMTTPIPLEVQIACVRREIRQRKRVYPRLVEDGRMVQATAARELATMTAVLTTLTALLEARQGELFHAKEPYEDSH